MLAATNIRPLQTVGDGTYVTMTWDDPNPAGTTTKVRFYDQANPTTEFVYLTRDLTARTYVCKGGQAIRLSLANSAGSTATDGVYYTAPAAVAYVPPTPPPVLSARQHVEAGLGITLPDGTMIGPVTVDPQFVVNADGSITLAP